MFNQGIAKLKKIASVYRASAVVISAKKYGIVRLTMDADPMNAPTKKSIQNP